MEVLLDPEELIACPYDNVHRIRRKKMPFHLVKCARNFPDSRLMTCDFNTAHRILDVELQHHHENCPSKKAIQTCIYQEEGSDLNKYPVHSVPVESEESWDDCNATAYNPKEYCEKNEVLRGLDVASAKSRRDFRIAERRRLQNTAAAPGPKPEKPDQKGPRRNVVLPEPLRRSEPTDIGEDPSFISDILAQVQLGAHQAYIPEHRHD